MKAKALILSLVLVASNGAAAHGQSATDLNAQATTMNNLATTAGESNVIGKISSDFNSFLGSNSTAVVTGLRNGTPITLKSPTTAPGTGTGTTATTNTTVITPPTGQMGHGNVYISLALAKQQLGDLGITQPTPQQLDAALNGGTITQTNGGTTTTTELPGILTMRSENMGWGQIAQKLRYKLGPVISSMKSANHSLAGNRPASTDATTSALHGNKNGMVSGGGASHGNSSSGIATGKGSAGSGIVSAAGRGGGNGHSYGRSGAVVTGSGGSAGSSAGGVVSAGGGGRGNSGGGQGKGASK